MKESKSWDSIILVIDRIQDGSMNTGQKKSWLVISSQDFIVYYRKLWVLFLGDGAVLAAVLAVLAVFCFVNDGWLITDGDLMVGFNRN